MKNTKAEIFSAIGGIGVLVLFLLLSPVAAVDLDFNVVVTGMDVSLVKVDTDYIGITNDSVTRYEQYVRAVGQGEFYYDSGGFISDNHDISVSTNLTGVRSPKSGIGGSHIIQNVGTGEHNETNSCCVFGIEGSGHNLTVVSVASIKPTTLDVSFVIEADRGEARVGWVKRTDNVTTKSVSEFRGRRIVAIGYDSCIRYPGGPAEEKSLKEEICPWGGDGRGYPVFTPRGAANGNETVGASSYKVWRR